MKIGIMCHASFGGSARIATELAAALAQRGHQVHLFARTPPFDVWKQSDGLTLHQIVPEREKSLHPTSLYTDWSSQEFLAFVARVMAVIRTDGLDVLHFHYALPFAFVTAEVKRRLGQNAPLLVGTLHGSDVVIHGQDPVKGPQLVQALNCLDGLTTVSANHARLAANVFKLPFLPQVIPNFVDLSRFYPLPASLPNSGRPRHPHPPTRASPSTFAFEKTHAAFSLRPDRLRPESTAGGQGSQGSKPRIIHISNFRPIKNPEGMAGIFAGIREHLEAELWLIGDGPKMPAVQSMLRQRGVEIDVRYWGLQNDVTPFLAQADLLLMTSRYESFCLAALEAMACGVPVLAAKVGGLPEVVIHGQTGYLFPANDYDSAVNFALGLLGDPTQHDMMRRAAVQHARRFGQDHIVPLYEALYHGPLTRQPAQPKLCLA